MSNCPRCGAGITGFCNWQFECGTFEPLSTSNQVEQSDVCKELCQLRERVAWLEKWREVVLGNLTYLFSRSLFWTATNARVFDEAAQELMEAKQ